MKNKALVPIVFLCFAFGFNWAQDPLPNSWPWKDIQEVTLPRSGEEEPQLPDAFRLLELDVTQMEAHLSSIPVNFSRTPEK